MALIRNAVEKICGMMNHATKVRIESRHGECKLILEFSLLRDEVDDIFTYHSELIKKSLRSENS